MYRCEFSRFEWKWMVYFTNNGKDDFICSFDSIEDAQDYCDMQNGALVTMQHVS
jgi:hypothetical protein